MVIYSRQKDTDCLLNSHGSFAGLSAEYLIDSGLNRSETALTSFYYWFQSLTLYARKKLICDRQKAFIPVNETYCDAFLFKVNTVDTRVPLSGHVFLPPYSVNKLMPSPRN